MTAKVPAEGESKVTWQVSLGPRGHSGGANVPTDGELLQAMSPVGPSPVTVAVHETENWPGGAGGAGGPPEVCEEQLTVVVVVTLGGGSVTEAVPELGALAKLPA